MSKKARAGGKFTGNHTSLIPAAILIADIADQCEVVHRISPGYIKAGLKSVGGQRRIKITVNNGYILVAVRDNISQQELHIYSTDTTLAKSYIAREAKRQGLIVSYAKN